jgi:hypothetical protein
MATDDKKQHEKILADAKAFMKEAKAYWKETYDRATEDKEFVTIKGAQWDDDAKAKRKAESKPTLEINLARTFVRQQINTMRQNRPQIQVVPVDSDADLEVAKILGGLIKDTEEATNAEDTYDQAAENAVFGGIGFLRLATDYVSEDSFNQEPKFIPVENPQAVLIDPMSRRLDGSDMTKCLVCEWVKKSVTEDQYGKDPIDFEPDEDLDWNDKTKDSLLIAEYFYIEQIKDELLLLDDGTIGFRSELKDQFDGVLDDFVVQSRTTYRTEIKWAKLTGSRVLETGVFPGKYIPIIPVYGEVTWIGENRNVFSLIHFAKDAQRLFNYWKSTEAHILQKNQDDITVADAQGVNGFEDQWENPSKYAAVYYNFLDDQGNQRPAPFKLGAAQPPSGILNAAVTSQQLIADTLNMHSPQMGQDVNQQSGRAIGLLQRQADTAHFHFQDNLNKALRHAGRILVGLYPLLYDTEITRRIVGNDGEDELVKLNAQPNSPDEYQKAEGKLLNDLTVGRYDVRMDTGPSFNTQREQSFQIMLQLLQFNPELAQIAGDLILKDSPLVNAKAIAERVKKRMDPSLLDDGKELPPHIKAQVTQMDQLIQKLTQDLQATQAALSDKKADREVEIKKAIMNAEQAIKVAQINNSGRADVEELRGMVELMKQQIDLSSAPQDWLQQGEDVDKYAPTKAIDDDEYPQSGGLEPPPDMTQQGIENPATEQGFLMPEESAQPNFALNPDQIKESALIKNGGDLLPNMEQQNDV